MLVISISKSPSLLFGDILSIYQSFNLFDGVCSEPCTDDWLEYIICNWSSFFFLLMAYLLCLCHHNPKQMWQEWENNY
jgi:hypothetical protein